MKNFMYWLSDKLFDEKANNTVGAITLTLFACYITFQVLRYFFRNLLIA